MNDQVRHIRVSAAVGVAAGLVAGYLSWLLITGAAILAFPVRWWASAAAVMLVAGAVVAGVAGIRASTPSRRWFWRTWPVMPTALSFYVLICLAM